ncbi:MAG: hypothetical protein GX259_09385 [Bacteroidales bacterium]|nr:hypothetical protein [Bacteroidales bacterium]
MKLLLSIFFAIIICVAAKSQFISSEEKFFIANELIPDSNFSALNDHFIFPKIVQEVDYTPEAKTSLLKRKLFFEHLLILKDENFNIKIDPVFDFRLGKEGENSIYNNTRGFIINGKVAKNFFIRSEFYETQARLPQFASEWVDTMGFVPGMIRAKQFGNNGYDYGVVFGQIMWQPVKNYGLRFGYDRFHVGQGYRSMILSDASQAYPFLMNSFAYKKWSLSHSIAILRNPDFNNRLGVRRSELGVYQPKWFSFTNFTYKVSEWLNLGLAESIVFMPQDSIGKRFYPLSLLPLPLAKTIAVESKGKHHAITSLQIDASFLKFFKAYSQIVFDKFELKNLEYQQGFEGAFQIGLQGCFGESTMVFSEFNVATNNAYTSNNKFTAFTNSDQPLAHPTGQQFREIIVGANWRYKRFVSNFIFSALYASALPITDNCLRADNYSDLLIKGFYSPAYSPDHAIHLQFTTSYIINPATNFNVFARLCYRKYDSVFQLVPKNTILYEFGIRHSIRKQYYDFF